MGKWGSRCGYLYRGVPETGGSWYTAEDQELLFSEAESDRNSAFGRARSIYACPNCAALSVEDDGGAYQFFVPAPGWMKVFVGRSQVDAYGGYSLDRPRTRRELSEQNAIVEPGLIIDAYGDSGWSETCSVETWVNAEGSDAEGRWAARHT
jgi:hypothetical protein